MKKVDVFAKLTTPGNQLVVSTIGSYDEENKILYYRETDEDETEMQFNFNENTLGRNNQNINMEYKFILGETTRNKIEVKDIEQTLLVSVKTIECKVTDRTAYIKYQIVDANEECIYQLEF